MAANGSGQGSKRRAYVQDLLWWAPGHKMFAQLLIMLDDMTRYDDNVLQIMHVEGALRVRNMVS